MLLTLDIQFLLLEDDESCTKKTQAQYFFNFSPGDHLHARVLFMPLLGIYASFGYTKSNIVAWNILEERKQLVQNTFGTISLVLDWDFVGVTFARRRSEEFLGQRALCELSAVLHEEIVVAFSGVFLARVRRVGPESRRAGIDMLKILDVETDRMRTGIDLWGT